MKKPHGHYCRICGKRKANEKFSGRGHAAHICKACAKRGNKPPPIIEEPPVFIDDENVNDFDGDIDTIFSASNAEKEKPPKPKKKRKPSKEKLLRAAQKKQAKAFLQRVLANCGEITSAEAHKVAANVGVSTEALHRAKGSLGIRAVTTEQGSVWRLPPTNNRKGSVKDSNE